MDITADGDIGGNVSDTTNGYDIRFTSDDEVTLLKYEREYFNVTTGTATGHYWVKCAPLAASTTDIYIYYNDGDGSVDGEDAANTWDADYMAVYHMKDITTSTIDDSTTVNDGTKKGANEPNEVSGKIYNGQDFDGSDDYIVVGDDNSLDITSGATLEFWSNCTNTSLDKQRMISKQNVYFVYEQDHDTQVYLAGLTTESLPGSVVVDDGEHHIAVTYDGSDIYIYVDGSQDTTVASTGSIDTSANDLYLGAREDSPANDWYDGILDELRISDIGRSVAWVKFTHANMNEADNELTWDSEATPPAVGYIPKVIMIT